MNDNEFKFWVVVVSLVVGLAFTGIFKGCADAKHERELYNTRYTLCIGRASPSECALSASKGRR